MTDKEKLDAIRAEIHRLVDVRGYDKEMANDLFTFMDSLPNEPISEELEEAARSYSNNLDNICGSIGEQTKNAFKNGANWQKTKDESITEDLGDYINELSKQFPEVSFAKLSRIAVRVAKWQREQINKALLSEVLPCFMHGGETDEVVAKLDEVLNQKK